MPPSTGASMQPPRNMASACRSFSCCQTINATRPPRLKAQRRLQDPRNKTFMPRSELLLSSAVGRVHGRPTPASSATRGSQASLKSIVRFLALRHVIAAPQPGAWRTPRQALASDLQQHTADMLPNCAKHVWRPCAHSAQLLRHSASGSKRRMTLSTRRWCAHATRLQQVHTMA
jgi:hypothetical protein